MNGAACKEWEEGLSALADGELDPAEARALEGHLADCPDCKASFERLQTVRDLVLEARRPVVPGDYLIRLRARMEAEEAAPPFALGWARLAGLTAMLVVTLGLGRQLKLGPFAEGVSSHAPSRPSVERSAAMASAPVAPASEAAVQGTSRSEDPAPKLDAYLQGISLPSGSEGRPSRTMKTWRPRPRERMTPVLRASAPTAAPRRTLVAPSAGEGAGLALPELGLASTKLASREEGKGFEGLDAALARDADELVQEPSSSIAKRDSAAVSERTPTRGGLALPADRAFLEGLYPKHVHVLDGEARELFTEGRDDRLRWVVDTAEPRLFFTRLRDRLDEAGAMVDAVLPLADDRWEIYVDLAAGGDGAAARLRLRDALADMEAVSGLAFLELTGEGEAPRGLWIVLNLTY